IKINPQKLDFWSNFWGPLQLSWAIYLYIPYYYNPSFSQCIQLTIILPFNDSYLYYTLCLLFIASSFYKTFVCISEINRGYRTTLYKIMVNICKSNKALL